MKKRIADDLVSITREIKKEYRKKGIKLSKSDMNSLVMARMASDKMPDDKPIGEVDKATAHRWHYNVTKTIQSDGSTLIVEKDF